MNSGVMRYTFSLRSNGEIFHHVIQTWWHFTILRFFDLQYKARLICSWVYHMIDCTLTKHRSQLHGMHQRLFTETWVIRLLHVLLIKPAYSFLYFIGWFMLIYVSDVSDIDSVWFMLRFVSMGAVEHMACRSGHFFDASQCDSSSAFLWPFQRWPW